VEVVYEEGRAVEAGRRREEGVKLKLRDEERAERGRKGCGGVREAQRAEGGKEERKRG
jgi:hypothetical protein